MSSYFRPKAKGFRRRCCKMLFHHVWQQLSDQFHAMEIEDLTSRVQTQMKKNIRHEAIEVKDAAIAFLNNDLQNREYENVVLEA